MILSGGTGQDLTMALGGFAGYSRQAVPQSPRGCSSPSLHCTHTVLILILSSLHNLLAHLSGARSLWGSGVIQEHHAQPMLCGTRQGSSQASSAHLGCVAQVLNIHHKPLHPQMSVTSALLDGETRTVGSHLRDGVCQLCGRQDSVVTMVHAVV